ncbi:IPT/TIG domain-containing protein [Spirillospora sp. CA-294931]|uniref:IPT/TIG domain-containing protein n=1 Tax=Spirillospora sp. CA-294931 TaxID=3240042 RepID=UPI003D8DEF80
MSEQSSVGSEFARTRDIVVIAVLLLLLTALLVLVFVQAWPPSPGIASDGRPESPARSSTMTLFGWDSRLSRESSMFVIVLAAGAIGSCVHALRSLYWYVGNRSLRRSWLTMYLFLPFVGALLGLVVYLVLRGGLTSPTGGTSDLNPYGVSAIAALVGLFSRETAEKLRTVFATLLAPAKPGRDQALPPQILSFEPASGQVGGTVVIHGAGLAAVTAVKFGHAAAPAMDVTDTDLRVTVPPGAVTAPLVVTAPAGTATSPTEFTVL